MFAVVCAGSKGIGRAVAEDLASKKYTILLNARNIQNLESAAFEISQKYSVRVESYAGDLTDSEVCKGLIAQAKAKFGRVDALLINAGGPKPGNFADVSNDDWLKGFAGTVMPVVHLVREALPIMQAQKFGRICAIESVSVKKPINNLILSNALRSAVVALFKSLSIEEAQNKITFNVVAPGMTATERLKSLMQANAEARNTEFANIEQEFLREIPMKRFAEPREIAAIAGFLLSKEASYITGQTILVDGGLFPGY